MVAFTPRVPSGYGSTCGHPDLPRGLGGAQPISEGSPGGYTSDPSADPTTPGWPLRMKFSLPALPDPQATRSS